MKGPSAELRGEVFTNALPAEDPVLYGSAKLSPEGTFEARSLAMLPNLFVDRFPGHA